MDGLLSAINREYGLTATQLKPFRSVWKLSTSKGVFLLKRMICAPERIYRLHQQITQLTQHGCACLTPFLTTRHGTPFLNYQEQTLVISPWLSGTQPSFSNLNCLKKAATIWGMLHCTSQNINPSNAPIIELLLTEYQNKLAFLNTTLDQIHVQKTPNRIDRSIERWGDHFLAQAALSIEYFKSFQQEPELKQASYGFCHNDPAPGNVVVQGQNWYLIDYEHSGEGLFFSEFALLLQRALKLNQWDAALLAPLTASYQLQRPSCAAEMELLPGLFCFPRSFWRLCQQRFNEKLNWSQTHFQSRLWEITHEETQRCKLLHYWFGNQAGLTTNLTEVPHEKI